MTEVEAPAAEWSEAQGRALMAQKISEIVLAVSHVAKGGRNAFHNYDYATEADVLAAVRQAMAERKLALIPEVTSWEVEKEEGSKDFITHVKLNFTLVDGDTGFWEVCPFAGSGLDRGEKGIYKAITGATKYFLLKLFLLPTGDDPERDEPHESTPVTVSAGRSPTAPAANPRMATHAQISMIWVRARELQLDDAEVHEALRVKAGVESITQLQKSKVDAVLEGLAQYAEYKKRKTEEPAAGAVPDVAP